MVLVEKVKPQRKLCLMILSAASSSSSALAMPAATLTLASGLAVLAYLCATLRGEDRLMRSVLMLGWLAQGVAIVVDVFGLTSPLPGARFGFAPALSVTTWLVIAVYAIESRLLPMPTARRALALSGALVVVLAWVFPGEARPHLGSAWAPLHWVLGFASYGLFGAAVFHAALWSHNDRRLRLKPTTGLTKPSIRASVQDTFAPVGMPLLKLETLTFDFVTAGFVVLSATLVLGWLFAHPWRWDHKTVLSVLSWFVFAALLLGRRVFGWRGRPATRWLHIGSALLLLAYAGSRFVFEVVLNRASGTY